MELCWVHMDVLLNNPVLVRVLTHNLHLKPHQVWAHQPQNVWEYEPKKQIAYKLSTQSFVLLGILYELKLQSSNLRMLTDLFSLIGDLYGVLCMSDVIMHAIDVYFWETEAEV